MKYKTLVSVVAIFLSVNVYADPTISVSGGRAVSNSISDEHSTAWEVEQETPTKYGTWLFGYLNEGHQSNSYGGDKRDGIYAQYEVPYRLTHTIHTSFAVGPYFTATTITDPDGIHYRDSYSTALLGTVGIKYSLNEKWSALFKWNHVIFAPRNKDADVFLIGVGYTPDY